MNKNEKKVTKKEVELKWSPIIDDMLITEGKKSWLEKYPKFREIDSVSDLLDVPPEIGRFTSRFYPKTIADNLVPVQPITIESDEERIKRETEIRKDKIDALIEGVDFKLTEKHKPKSTGPKIELMYIDFKYNAADDVKTKDGDLNI